MFHVLSGWPGFLPWLPPAMVPAPQACVECDDGEDEPGAVRVEPAGGQVGEGGALEASKTCSMMAWPRWVLSAATVSMTSVGTVVKNAGNRVTRTVGRPKYLGSARTASATRRALGSTRCSRPTTRPVRSPPHGSARTQGRGRVNRQHPNTPLKCEEPLYQVSGDLWSERGRPVIAQQAGSGSSTVLDR